MHHEVLLALSGYPGNIFTVNRRSGLFEVTPDLPFIHPSEASLVNRICRLGTYYLQLTSFISEQDAASLALTGRGPAHRDKGSGPSRGEGGGLYLKSLACGIDGVLDSYRQALVRAEQKCINEPHLTLSLLQSEFEEYQQLLPSLDGCVKHILRNKLHGCQVLSHLYEQCSSGNPVVQSAYERILAMCHGVLYKQLSTWMLHGMLMDEHGDFFIEPATQGRSSAEDEGGTDTGERRETEEVGGRTDSGVFKINHGLAPSYIPLRVIEKILFVGEAVQIFQSQSHSHQQLADAGSQLRADQLRFGRMLASLQRQPVFQLREFESTIDSIRDCIAEHLWRLLVEESNLVRHLRTVKDFFLLGRGELFLAFVDLANSFMRLPPAQTTQHDVNVAFQQAMLKVGIENEDLMKQFTLTVTTLPPSLPGGVVRRLAPPTGPAAARKENVGVSAWSRLGLTHTVSWPMHILFTPAILEKYNSLFVFLLALRRAQTALQQSWLLLMQYRERAEELKSVWQLRTHMGFLIDNLQYYVQVDVLEAQFSQLLEKINSTHDFETIKHAHESFVTTLQAQLFLFLAPVSRCLHEILELCNSFSAVVHRHSELRLSTEERVEVDRIAKDFQRQSSLFFKVISSMKGHHSAPHLAQLLLRVDYNKFFSTHSPLASTAHSTTS